MRSLLTITTLISLSLGGVALGSSHREAPEISRDPEADITDVYVFQSPDQTDKYTMIMNVSPAYQAYAGPNWYRFGDDVLYEIHIDTTGDAIEDVTYQFRFKTDDYRGKEGAIISNFPQITYDAASNSYKGSSLTQTYTVTRVAGNRRTGERSTVAESLPVAPPRIGPHTTDGGAANADDLEAMYDAYKTLASKAIQTVQGRTYFAGPRNDPFFVDLGGVFDSVAVRIPGVTGTPRDALETSNVLSIAIELDKSDFLGNGAKHFGVWATTSRKQGKILRTGGKESKLGGAWVQVSRLGNPLVNEVVIKMHDKDKFNNTEPKDDAANYAGYVTDPQLAAVLNLLYSGNNGQIAPNVITPIETSNRTDLVAAFVTGIPGVNKHPNASATGGDMIRVNIDFALQEWPLSGRRLEDDVVKSALAFLAQCTKLAGNTGAPDNPFGKVAPAAPGESAPANCALDDFVTVDSDTPGATPGTSARNEFPYMDLPFSSYGKRN